MNGQVASIGATHPELTLISSGKTVPHRRPHQSRPQPQPRLFEKFYRGVQRKARKQHGSGLGLAIVRSIAERHGGKAWLESQLGRGSTFFLLIPYEQPEGEKKVQNVL